MIDTKDQVGSRTEWHPAFCAALCLNLGEEMARVRVEEEYQLTSGPKKIDCVIRKPEEVQIRSGIGKYFTGHNLIEYKSPSDQLNLNTALKAVGYACDYAVSTKHSEIIELSDITIFLIRDGKPEKLMREIRKINGDTAVQLMESGIYQLGYVAGFRMLLIVTSELDEEENIALKPLTKNLTEVTYEKYLKYIEKLDNQGKQLADITMQVVVAANNERISEWKRRNGEMCEALKEIMREEIEEGKAEGKVEGRLMAMVELVRDNLLSIAEAAKRLEMPENELRELI